MITREDTIAGGEPQQQYGLTTSAAELNVLGVVTDEEMRRQDPRDRKCSTQGHQHIAPGTSRSCLGKVANSVDHVRESCVPTASELGSLGEVGAEVGSPVTSSSELGTKWDDRLLAPWVCRNPLHTPLLQQNHLALLSELTNLNPVEVNTARCPFAFIIPAVPFHGVATGWRLPVLKGAN